MIKIIYCAFSITFFYAYYEKMQEVNYVTYCFILVHMYNLPLLDVREIIRGNTTVEFKVRPSEQI